MKKLFKSTETFPVIGDKNKISYHIVIQRIRDVDGVCDIEQEEHYNRLEEDEIIQIEEILQDEFEYDTKSIIKTK